MGTIGQLAVTKARQVLDLFFAPLHYTHYLELVNPLWNYRSLRAMVKELADETADCRTITLRPGRGWRKHRAGQHIRVGVMIAGVRHTRTYSISSAPDRPNGLITITVKRTKDGHVSRYLTKDLKVGTFLAIGLPQGDFVMPDAVPVRSLFITGGSGITPIMSMLRSLVSPGGLPDISHIHFSPNPFDIIFGRELKQLAEDNKRYRQSIISTRANQAGVSQHFSTQLLEKLCPDWRSRDVWVCGPQSLIDTVTAHWEAAGLSAQLHVERFHAQVVALPPDAQGGQVTFVRSKRKAQSSGGQNLLQLAEDAGLSPAYGCRMGICQGCVVKLQSGNIRDLRTGSIIQCESGQKVQLCVTAAAGDLELDV